MTAAERLPWFYRCGSRCSRGRCEHEMHVADLTQTMTTHGLSDWELEAHAELFYGPEVTDLRPGVRLTMTSTAFEDWAADVVLTHDEVTRLCRMLEAVKIDVGVWAAAASGDGR